jgi:hypothetical protein
MSARLILHVRDPDYVPSSVRQIERVLQEVGLIGEPWGEASQQRYLIGECFLQLITFLGCAPAIELEPPTNGNTEFCHVGISDFYISPRFLADTQNVLPRCPHCRKRFEGWQDAIQQWQDDPTYQAQCPACQMNLSPTELDWRQSAGFGRLFISIFNIYPREAIPTEALLHTLDQLTDQTWDYFYLRDA